MSSAWPRSATAPFPITSTRSRSAISFLSDVRAYRERQLAPTGLEPLFPLWEIPTDQLARDMIAGGLRARLACVDTKQLPASFAGREFDAALLRDLPAGRPCGERGEFHTCVHDGPMFNAPLPLEEGEVVERDGFVYADFLCQNEVPALQNRPSNYFAAASGNPTSAAGANVCVVSQRSVTSCHCAARPTHICAARS